METITLKAQPERQKEALTIPLEALDLLVALDGRGLQAIQGREPTQLRICRKDGERAPDLTDEDRESIRKWKTHLLALVVYCREDN